MPREGVASGILMIEILTRFGGVLDKQRTIDIKFQVTKRNDSYDINLFDDAAMLLGEQTFRNRFAYFLFDRRNF